MGGRRGRARPPTNQPTPEEAKALAKLNELRQQAIAQGWGDRRTAPTEA